MNFFEKVACNFAEHMNELYDYLSTEHELDLNKLNEYELMNLDIDLMKVISTLHKIEIKGDKENANN